MVDRKFSALELHRINEADDLKISPFRSDGFTYGTQSISRFHNQ